ncbi:MAG: hypothetical protein P4M11_09900 [Candidatus Pacebacteria bacterium]|nr:hypothetical protein [Candidatus Paceibacterota bacterium]
MASTNSTLDYTNRIALIEASYTSVKDYEEQLRVSGTDFSDRSDIDNLLSAPYTVNMYAANQALTKQYMFSEVDNQILSVIFALMQYPLTYYYDLNEAVYFYMQNTAKKNGSYMEGLFSTIAMYKDKAQSLDRQFNNLNLLFFLISFGFTISVMALVLAIYLKIRKSKLQVMSFFIHIPSKTLEEIIQNCDEFVSSLTLTDVRIADVEESQQEILPYSRDDETGSSVSMSQQQYYKRYKKHHPRHNRVLSDDCYMICCTVFKFFMQFILVAVYFIAYFLVGMIFHANLKSAGQLSEKNSLVELDSINMLVLMKESIQSDASASTLSTMYTQLNVVINDTISLMKDLESVPFPSATLNRYKTTRMWDQDCSGTTRTWCCRTFAQSFRWMTPRARKFPSESSSSYLTSPHKDRDCSASSPTTGERPASSTSSS